MNPLVIQFIILAILFCLAILGILIYRQLKLQNSSQKLLEIETKLNHENEEIRRTLESLQQKLQTLDSEFENRIVPKVNATKEDIVNQLYTLKENITKTSHEINSKTDLSTSETKERLIEIEKEINKTIKDISQSLTENTSNLIIDIKNSVQKINTEFLDNMGKTKEDLISELKKLKEIVNETSLDFKSKTDLSSKETSKKLIELEKNINKTIKDISQSVSENSTSLVKDIKNTIHDINKEFGKSTSTLSEKLGKIDEQLKNIEKISSEIKELQEILKPPKQRGTFGELLLENLIKDMFPKDKYQIQYPIGTNKVDIIIKLDGRILPIDSKFPLDNFKKLTEKNGSKKTLKKNVKSMIDEISQKYIKPSEYKTTNFALMYIPSESIWYELFVMEPDTYKYSVEKRVFPVSPNTLFAYLQVISEGLKAFQIEKDVEHVISEINSLRNEINQAVTEYETLEKHLNNALKKVSSTRNLLEKINIKIESFGKSKNLEEVSK